MHMSPLSDWLSRLLELVPVRGHLDIRCSYGAPWRIDRDAGKPGEIPYHVVVGGSAVLEGPAGGRRKRLVAGDIVMLPHGSAHILHDGSGKPAAPAHFHPALNFTITENAGTGDRLDLLCGRFVVTPPHDRMLRGHLPPILVVQAADHGAAPARLGTGSQLASLIALMRQESAVENLGGRAMLNALSTAMFALALRLASESAEAPVGLLALAGHPRLAPALTAILQQPERAWTLPELARLCHMSRATLARQFQDALGRSAADLLTDVRMTLAANELKKPSVSTAAVADIVGYQSEAAFQRAFKQRMGMTPAHWRRQTQSSIPSD
jgi:AraC family transcriptional regulator, activator of mtrCDE